MFGQNKVLKPQQIVHNKVKLINKTWEENAINFSGKNVVATLGWGKVENIKQKKTS